MTRTFAFIPFLLAACAPGGEAAPDPSDSVPPGAAALCDLKISFGSYAVGIDRTTYDRSLHILEDRSVRSVEKQGWGREGEVTLCARTRSPADAERLFKRIAAILPQKPTGPIHLSTASGLSIAAPPSR